jgi:hypothetical protein
MLLSTACAATSGAMSGTGIEGIITAGPSCPNAQQVSPCPDEPVAAEVKVLDASGGLVTTFRSDSAGRFKVNVSPGTYTLAPISSSPAPGVPPFAPTATVKVTAGKYTWVQLKFDTGIR